VLLAVSVAGRSTQALEEKLRNAPVPVIGRIWKDTFLLDMRTIMDTDMPDLLTALRFTAA
jgi:L-seryl-tRNA(Ser) seleniumtransferase